MVTFLKKKKKKKPVLIFLFFPKQIVEMAVFRTIVRSEPLFIVIGIVKKLEESVCLGQFFNW